MALTITDERMTSDQTCHRARHSPYAAADGQGAWIVSWLPLRLLDRIQATTAMTLAELVATHELPGESQWWPVLNAWAAELQLTGADAVRRVRVATWVPTGACRDEVA